MNKDANALLIKKYNMSIILYKTYKFKINQIALRAEVRYVVVLMGKDKKLWP